MEDLVIVGASFAGLECARSAARRGLRVHVLERQPFIGCRVHTTGLVVKEAAEAWDVPERFVRRIHGVRLYGPSLASIDLASPGYYFLATDTAALLRWFASEARACGARVVPRAPYGGALRVRGGFELRHRGLRTRMLVGADGARSAVARDLGLGLNERYLFGIEEEYQGVRGIEDGFLHCFLDSSLAPGYIAWAIPGVNGLTQVGLACRRGHRPDADALRARLGRLFDFSAARLVERRAGLIPVGGPVSPCAAEGVLLVGDAAGLVSPLTAGGIHSALDSGRRAAHAIANHLLEAGPAPHAALQSIYRVSAWKQLLRRLIDLDPPNALYDLALGSPALRAFAQLVYFHKRGIFSPRARRELFSLQDADRGSGAA